MNIREIEEAAEQFWLSAAMPPTFPRPIERAAQRALPLWIVKWPSAEVPAVTQFLLTHRLTATCVEDDDLKGCLYAYRGRGIIFVSGEDDEYEQRYTIAHEIAHFLRDYYRPRLDVIRVLGPSATEVLDGARSPTHRERLHATLARMRLGPHLQVLPRHDNSQRIRSVEDYADALGMELVAPSRAATAMMREMESKPTDEILQALGSSFGLPSYVFEPLLASVRRTFTGGLLDFATDALRR